MKLRRLLLGVAALSAAGLAIAIYLGWIYTTGGTLACGASGGCAAVQASPYAYVAGIPVPGLGAVAYAALLAAALLAIWWEARRGELLLAIFGLALAGVLFSAYLTWLELFVIEAICRWCVASALIMLLAFVLAVLAYREGTGE